MWFIIIIIHLNHKSLAIISILLVAWWIIQCHYFYMNNSLKNALSLFNFILNCYMALDYCRWALIFYSTNLIPFISFPFAFKAYEKQKLKRNKLEYFIITHFYAKQNITAGFFLEKNSKRVSVILGHIEFLKNPKIKLLKKLFVVFLIDKMFCLCLKKACCSWKLGFLVKEHNVLKLKVACTLTLIFFFPFLNSFLTIFTLISKIVFRGVVHQ